MTTLGEAFIEIHADTKPFDRELAAKLKAAVAAAGDKVEPEAVKTGRKVSRGVAEGVDKDSNWITRAFRRIGNLFGKEGQSWTDKIKAPFDKMAKGNFILTRLFGQTAIAVGGFTRKLFQLTSVSVRAGAALLAFAAVSGELVATSLKVAIGLGGDFTKVMGNLATAGSEVAASFAAFFAQILSLAPAVIALVGVMFLLVAAIGAIVAILTVALAPFATLIGFLVTLPSLISAVLVVILPLVIALHGVSDALALVFEKDPKKFADGLKKLPPIMQQLVNTLRPLRGEFDKFRASIQTAFLGPILTKLNPFLKQVLPVLRVGFTGIAQAMGNIVLNIMRLLSSRAALDGLATIMGSVAQFMDTNSGTITALIQALGKTAVAMLPTVLELFTKLSGFLTDFAAWIEGAITDGRFQKWLDTAIASAKSIWNLILALIGLFKEMFSQTDEGGRKFLDKITEALNKFTAWLKSPQGMEALKNAVAFANLFADALKLALNYTQFILGVFNKIADVLRWIRDNPILAPVLGAFGTKKSFSGGGVVPHDEIALVHKGEPILDPANSVGRNRSILQDAGMLDVLSGSTIVNVYLGTEQLDARIERKVATSNVANARALINRPRTV